MWGIIGGSGFEQFSAFKILAELDRNTPFGKTSTGFKKISMGGIEAVFIPRHGDPRTQLPHEINYSANIFALKQAGAEAILSLSAVGSLQNELEPGDMVIPHQYIDATKGKRQDTFCGDGIMGHVDIANPICPSLSKHIDTTFFQHADFPIHTGGTYVCIDGPYFSTLAEANIFRHQGADIIGMTNYPEYALAREAGIHYLPCCFIVNYSNWNTLQPAVVLEDIYKILKKNNTKAFYVAQSILNSGNTFYDHCNCASQGLAAALMTPIDTIADDKLKWLNVLLNKTA